jgi:MoxR-like ATPase
MKLRSRGLRSERIALPALRHRIAIAPELEIEGLRADDVLRSVLESVEAPRE